MYLPNVCNHLQDLCRQHQLCFTGLPDVTHEQASACQNGERSTSEHEAQLTVVTVHHVPRMVHRMLPISRPHSNTSSDCQFVVLFGQTFDSWQTKMFLKEKCHVNRILIVITALN
jgi:hypothetical protein